MDMVAPVGPVYQAGTLSGNPIAMSCGYTLLKELNENPNIYTSLEENTAYFEQELRRVFDNKNLKYAINRVGSMISFHFDVDTVQNFEDACSANADFFKKLFHGVLKKGVYFAPSAFESLFLSSTHSIELLDKTIQAIEETLEEIL
jgi:glutamate-1-semialdehyde 2,1-aminomutase